MFKSKTFDNLTTTELYEIIKSRTEVFLLEQSIVCQDLDDMDYKSLHCFIEENGRVIAYLRAFMEDSETGTVKVGRVLTLDHGKGIGRELMKKSLEEIKKTFNCSKIHINSQKHAVGFYEKFGLKTCSDEFLEEGVVHISMEYTI
ncbi:MAG: GNAT family N-acetyltransferase [Ruminococcaceae bacterium]|nr:GNAT family N-acetyltransferase [Oscillospiraceae bacterium]